MSDVMEVEMVNAKFVTPFVFSASFYQESNHDMYFFTYSSINGRNKGPSPQNNIGHPLISFFDTLQKDTLSSLFKNISTCHLSKNDERPNSY